MPEPADAAETGRVGESAPSGEARGPQPAGSLVEQSIDGWGEGGALDRNLAVGLDEHEEDVLATEPGQKLVRGGVAVGVVLDLLCEDGGVVDIRLHGADLVDDEARSARGRDGGPGEKLRAESRSE